MPAAQTASSTPPTRSGPTDPLGGRPPRRLRRRLARLLLLLTALATLSVAASWWLVQREAGRTFDRVADVPERHVGLVLGCSPLLADGRPNLFFKKTCQANGQANGKAAAKAAPVRFEPVVVGMGDKAVTGRA